MTLSITERLARMRQEPAVQAAPDIERVMNSGTAAPPVPVESEPRRPTYAEVTGRPERASAPPPALSPPAGAPSMFDRMRNLTQRAASAQPRVDAEPAPARERLAWDDRSRPAGSAFSCEEWEAVRAGCGFEHAIVFEVHKAAERGLVPLNAATLDAVHAMFLDQALLIDERLAEHPAWHNAQARLEHHSEDLGTWTYRVVHAAEALARCPGLRGAKLVEGEPRAPGQTPRPRG